MVMGEVHLGAEKYDEAIRWYQQAVELKQDDNRAKEGLQKAQAALKQSKEVDYYKVRSPNTVAKTAAVGRVFRAHARVASRSPVRSSRGPTFLLSACPHPPLPMTVPLL